MKRKLTIEGMSCMHCVKNVHDALMDIRGVVSVNIDLKTKTAFLESKEIINNEKIKNAVNKVGYEVTEIEKILM